MGRKGKTQKHTAKEIASKVQASKNSNGAAGHGSVGLAARKDNMMKIQVKCEICLAIQPHMSGMKNHYESKHAKVEWKDDLYASQFEATKKTIKKSHTIFAKDDAPKKKATKDDFSALDGY